MSRSAADATRFTATGPYANSKPYDLSNSAKVKSSADKNARVQHTGPDGKPETPKQKVERLRAQARAARMASSASGADRWIESGRKFANKAHKAVVYSLIAASGVCGALTVYSLVSLTLYNRRQRAVFIEREKDILNQARIAHASGSATQEQIELVEQVEITEIMKRKRDEEKANRPWAKAKRFLFERANAEDTAAAATAVAASPAANTESVSVTDAVKAKNAFDAASANTDAVPGQLDVMGENAERAAKEKTRSWIGWLTGR